MNNFISFCTFVALMALPLGAIALTPIPQPSSSQPSKTSNNSSKSSTRPSKASNSSSKNLGLSLSPSVQPILDPLPRTPEDNDRQLREDQIKVMKFSIENNWTVYDLLRLRRDIENQESSQKMAENTIKINVPLTILAPRAERIQSGKSIAELNVSSKLAETYATYFTSQILVAGFCLTVSDGCKQAIEFACQQLKGYDHKMVMAPIPTGREQNDTPITGLIETHCKI